MKKDSSKTATKTLGSDGAQEQSDVASNPPAASPTLPTATMPSSTTPTSQCTSCPMPEVWGKPCFNPLLAIEGDPNSSIWIVGLNPKTKQGQHIAGQCNPIKWQEPNKTPKQVSAIRHFARLAVPLGSPHPELLQPAPWGIASTDLLKCGSPRFGRVERAAVDFCFEYLLKQLQEYQPKLLLVFSADASRKISHIAGFHANDTEGVWNHGNGQSTFVLLSGYINPGKDTYSSLRFRHDFLRACTTLGLLSPTKITEPNDAGDIEPFGLPYSDPFYQTPSNPSLSNSPGEPYQMDIQQGHNSAQPGSLTSAEPISDAAKPDLVNASQACKRVFIFPIHNALAEGRTVYDATRYCWNVNPRFRPAQPGDFAVGIVNMEAKGVFEISKWEKCQECDDGRYQFVSLNEHDCSHKLPNMDFRAIITEAWGFWLHGGYLIIEFVKFEGKDGFKFLRGARDQQMFHPLKALA